MRMRLRDDTCHITVDGWCATHSDRRGPMYCLEQTRLDDLSPELARQHIKWREVVHSYPCPTCTAGPGDWCLTMHGERKYEPHSDRSRVASAHDWKLPDERPS